MTIVTLLTDFGTADSYVAEMKGVLLTCAPITDPHYAPLPIPRIEGNALVGQVIYVDRFGTLVSNISPSALKPDANIRVGTVDVGPLRRTFADVASGALMAFTGSGGTVEIAVRDGSAMRLLGLSVGAEVRA